ncbi:MAG: 50S ribosomal protein L25 [Gemmatimonadetes bacterium]|nr:50S ribosomal protein L25 [Gemmatimonadota bacterium]
MTQNIRVGAERRSTAGKGAARELRRNGRLPAIIYGHGRNPESLSISEPEFTKVVASLHGDVKSTLFDLEFEGNTVTAVIRELQRHPSRLNVLHVDFMEIHAGEEITLDIPIHLVGIPDGVRNAGGVLDQVLREISISVLPKDISEHVDLDVTDLTVGSSLHVSDISIPNATILTDGGKSVCSVVPPRVEAEEEVVVSEEEPTDEEPELIRKLKPEDTEEESAEE